MLGFGMHQQHLFSISDGILVTEAQKRFDGAEGWMVIYFNNEKIGYSRTETSWVKNGYDILEFSHLVFNVRGDKQTIQYQLKTNVDPNFLLKSFEFRLASDLGNSFLQGMIQGEKLNVTMYSQNNKTHSVFSLEQVPCVSNNLMPYLLNKGLSVGERYNLAFFDPFTMNISNILLDVTGKEALEHTGQPIMTYRLKESYNGIEKSIWVTETGEKMKEKTISGFTFIRGNKKMILSTQTSQEDVIKMTAIPTDKLIKNARKVKRLKLKLDNISVDSFNLDGCCQSRMGNILEILREDLATPKPFVLPYNKKELRKYIQSTPLIQSGHEKIIKQARAITDGYKLPEKAARMLLKWVYHNLQKKSYVGIPSALDVLDIRAGDCNEHAVLFTALCRSVGIPARLSVGLVYMSDAFYYHAWTEIFLENWIPVDPMFNQFPADATHVRFCTGNLGDQIRILSLVGKLSLEVIDYS